MTKHKTPIKLEYDNIVDDIYIGTNRCCTLFLDDMLKEEGVVADFSLEEVSVDQPFGVEIFVWIPVRNHTAPSLSQLDTGAAILEKLVEQKKKVYVHCERGHGRAPTMVAAYLIQKGMGVDEAIALIKSKRPGIHIEPVQYEALVEFQAYLRRRKRKNNAHHRSG